MAHQGDIQSLEDVLCRAAALKTNTDPYNCAVVSVQLQCPPCALCSLDVYKWIISDPKGRKNREGDKMYAGGGTKAAREIGWLQRTEPK